MGTLAKLDYYIDSYRLNTVTSLQAAKHAIEFVERTRRNNIFLRLTGGGPMWAEETESAKRLRRLGIHTVAIFGCITSPGQDTFTFVYEQITEGDKIPWLKEMKCDVVYLCDRFDHSSPPEKLAEDTFSTWEDLYKEYLLNE